MNNTIAIIAIDLNKNPPIFQAILIKIPTNNVFKNVFKINIKNSPVISKFPTSFFINYINSLTELNGFKQKIIMLYVF